MKTKSQSKKNTALWRKVSEAMQNYYRRIGGECLGKSEKCLGRMNVMHHYFQYGNCVALRLEEKNLVPLCSKCHCSVHHYNKEVDYNIRQGMMARYGESWESELLDKRKAYKEKTPLEMADFLKQSLITYNESE